MLIVTTESVPGKNIKQALGVVSANAVVDPKATKNVFEGTYGKIISKMRGKDRPLDVGINGARDEAMDIMARLAKENGANAIVGLSFDIEFIPGNKEGVAALLVFACGTPVVTD